MTERYVLIVSAVGYEIVDTRTGHVVGTYRSGAYARAMLTLSNAIPGE